MSVCVCGGVVPFYGLTQSNIRLFLQAGCEYKCAPLRLFPFTSHECRWKTVPNQASLIHLMRVLKMQSTCTKPVGGASFSLQDDVFITQIITGAKIITSLKSGTVCGVTQQWRTEDCGFVWAGRTLITALAGCFFTAAPELRLNNI